MAFEIYKGDHGARDMDSKWISVSRCGAIAYSAGLVRHLGLNRKFRHELYFDRDSNRIGIKFVPPGSNGNSRYISVLSNGKIQIDGASFFHKFKINAPAKATRFEAQEEGDMIVFSYPEILVGAE